MRTSIFGSLQKDFLLFYAPALLIALILLIHQTAPIEVPKDLAFVLLFLMFYQFETGHNFATGMRVFRQWNRETLFFLVLIPTIFFLSWFLAYHELLWFVRLRFYWGIFHHIKQYWGLSAWYQKINGRFEWHTKFFSQVLPLLPLLAYHFDPYAKDVGYFLDRREIILWPSLAIYRTVLVVFVATVLFWIYCEFKSYRRFGFERNRVMSVFCPSLLHAGIFFGATNAMTILAPLVVGHGFTYMCLTAYSMQRLTAVKLGRCFLSIGAIAFVGGLSVYALERLIESPDGADVKPLVYSLLLAFATLSTFWHSVVDGIIWKSGHREAKAIFGT